MKDIDEVLKTTSYIGGWYPSKKDVDLYNLCRIHENGGFGDWVNLMRWYNHIKSFSSEECSIFLEPKMTNSKTLENIDCLLITSKNLDKKVRQKLHACNSATDIYHIFKRCIILIILSDYPTICFLIIHFSYPCLFHCKLNPFCSF